MKSGIFVTDKQTDRQTENSSRNLTKYNLKSFLRLRLTLGPAPDPAGSQPPDHGGLYRFEQISRIFVTDYQTNRQTENSSRNLTKYNL